MSHPPSHTPSIRIYGSSASQQNGSTSDSAKSSPFPSNPLSSSPAIPMPIRSYSSRDTVPPPLPPPRILKELNEGQDPGWQWANGKVNRESGNVGSITQSSPIKPGSSPSEHLPIESRTEDVSQNVYAPGPRPPISLSLPLHGRYKATEHNQTQRPVLPR
jgi:hypothetical protein